MRAAIAGVLLLAGCDRIFQLHRDDPDAQLSCRGGEYAGGGGLLGVCVDTAVPEQLALPADLVTGDVGDLGNCTIVVTQADAAATQVCVIAAYRIEITRAVRVRGRRPLALVAVDDLMITNAGSIDVKSRDGAVGAGSSVAMCDVKDGSAGGGGAAGGSFAQKGGSGGIGGGAGGPSGVAANAIGLDVVRGGCRGGTGGASAAGNAGGVGGDSGGAIYLIAGGAISVSGTIEASGGQGGGGALDSSGRGGGGGGGGSGGLIALDAPMVEITKTAKLSANGGGAGGGGGSTVGMAGLDNDAFGGSYPWISLGGLGGSSGGSGGVGGQVSSPYGNAGAPAQGGGGGGGGGVGFIRLYGERLGAGTALSPAPNT